MAFAGLKKQINKANQVSFFSKCTFLQLEKSSLLTLLLLLVTQIREVNANCTLFLHFLSRHHNDEHEHKFR